MRLEIITTTPNDLLSRIKKDIKATKIKTWSIVTNSANEEFFTHNPDQWFKKALLKPAVKMNKLVLTINWFVGIVPDDYTKGLYVGRMTEEILEHYKADITKLEIFP